MTMTSAQVAQAQYLLSELDQVNLSITTLAAMAAASVATIDITVSTAGYSAPVPAGSDPDAIDTTFAGTRFTVTVPLTTAQAIVSAQQTSLQSQLAALGVSE